MRVHGPAVRRAFTAIVGGKSAGIACGATLASVLWVGVTVPNLALLSGLGGDPANERIAVSLQSALLGIQDRVNRAAPAVDLAARDRKHEQSGAECRRLRMPRPNPAADRACARRVEPGGGGSGNELSRR